MLDCKGGSQEKWSSGLQEALPTNHNGDVPNGYAWRARTPMVQPNPNFSNPDFIDPSRSGSRF
jgi:hypothetical protein